MKKKIIALTMAATLLLAPAAYAHGGHHGAHHAQHSGDCTATYTCNGYAAHQHDNGVCPYQSSADTTVSFEDLNTAGVQSVIRHCQSVLYMPMSAPMR